MCARERPHTVGGGGAAPVQGEEGWRWLCPVPAVQFRFPPLVRRRTALWRSTRCTTKFGGLNKLGGRPLGELGKTGQAGSRKASLRK